MAKLTWTTRFPDNVACIITCQGSTDLANWTDVPDNLVQTDATTGRRTARFPINPLQKAFLRLKITSTP